MPAIEHWSGHRWAVVEGAAVPGNDTLSCVAAVGVDDAWAVGFGDGGPGRQSPARAAPGA